MVVSAGAEKPPSRAIATKGAHPSHRRYPRHERSQQKARTPRVAIPVTSDRQGGVKYKNVNFHTVAVDTDYPHLKLNILLNSLPMLKDEASVLRPLHLSVNSRINCT